MTLDIITHHALEPMTHGFFGRKGGASSGVFEGLNCGAGSSDQSDVVRVNRGYAAQAMGVAPDQMAGVHQVHSAEVLTVGPEPEAGVRADGLVTATPGVALSVLAADCQPVLFADPDAQVIGAAHAGWRGALDGVLDATVEAMVGLGATREKIQAVIGPCISQRAYEVGPEFFDRFLDEEPDNTRFFAGGQGDRMMFDLPSYGLARLRAAGVEATWTGHCTYSDPERFYSYRRSTHEGANDYGRLISVITL